MEVKKMAKEILRQKAIAKVLKAGTVLFFYHGGAVVQEYLKGECVRKAPITDFHVAIKTSDGKILAFHNQEDVQVLFSNKHRVCWVECKKTVSTELSDEVVEWMPLKGKIILAWAEAVSAQEGCTLNHYLTADVSESGTSFMHVEEMLATKELLDDFMTVMAELKNRTEPPKIESELPVENKVSGM